MDEPWFARRPSAAVAVILMGDPLDRGGQSAGAHPLPGAPARPAWVDGVNALGANLGGAEHLVALDGPSLLGAARAATGLDEFGDIGWREPFGILVEAIAREAHLNTVGRLMTRAELVRVLANRLRLVDLWKRHPEILDGEVRAPIFIVGTARSGTSILQEVLAQDPRLRSPATWEAFYSVPPPETATYATDERIAGTDHEVKLWHEVAPEYLTMHANAAVHPQECIFLMAHELASEHFSGVLDVPSYAVWLATHDLTPSFRFHRRMLQTLQWRAPAERWLLKAPSHLPVLPALFAVYPDAHIVFTHRDPAKTVPSTASLMATLRRMRRDHVDEIALAKLLVRGVAMGLEKMMTERETGAIPDAQFVDVRYADLMKDPLAAIASVYGRLGLDLPGGIADRMRAYLASKPRGKHGAHRYDPGDVGIDLARLRTRYARYTERFGVPEE
jgi:hypothetical protein